MFFDFGLNVEFFDELMIEFWFWCLMVIFEDVGICSVGKGIE